MNTLIWFVVLYWIVSVGIGIYAARFVRNSKDFAVAGRSLPMSVVTAMVFATWFGSEAVLGIPATFVQKGFGRGHCRSVRFGNVPDYRRSRFCKTSVSDEPDDDQ